jgi:hypothetical protein
MKKNLTYEVTNYETLNVYLLDTLRDIRKKEIAIEQAHAISRISDKIIKNNLTMLMEAKRIGNYNPIPFFKPIKK